MGMCSSKPCLDMCPGLGQSVKKLDSIRTMSCHITVPQMIYLFCTEIKFEMAFPEDFILLENGMAAWSIRKCLKYVIIFLTAQGVAK